MTLEEKIATKPELERIDSSIESCIKIMHQELRKRAKLKPGWEDYINQMLNSLEITRDDFEMMRRKG